MAQESSGRSEETTNGLAAGCALDPAEDTIFPFNTLISPGNSLSWPVLTIDGRFFDINDNGRAVTRTWRELKPMKRLIGQSMTIFAVAAAIAAPTWATTTAAVPDATYDASLGKYANFTSVAYSGIGSYSDGYSSVTLASQPSPFIDSLAYGTDVNYDPAVLGRVIYYVGIVGPADGSLVPVNVSYAMRGKIELSGNAYDAYAQANLTLQSYYRGNPVSIVHVTHDGNFDVSASTAWAIASGTSGQVTLETIAGLVVDGVGAHGSADAFIDPVFTIDPAFAATHPGYSLVFSGGAGNSPSVAVPEPASWALLIGGLGIAGAALRRRRPLRPSAREA